MVMRQVQHQAKKSIHSSHPQINDPGHSNRDGPILGYQPTAIERYSFNTAQKGKEFPVAEMKSVWLQAAGGAGQGH